MKQIYLKIKSVFFIYILVGITVASAQTHITTAAELNAIRDDAHGSFILDNDIDMDGFSWGPFEFYGTLDGNGFSIKNLEVEINDENAGLFSVINGATVKNLGIEDVYVMCTNQGGAIAGVAVNGATIEKCFATGEINSGGLTGGFIGRADESTVSESYTKITVNGHDHVGGLVGHMNGGTIVNCYTNSTVYSDGWQVGGLVGWAQNAGASISKSFAKGTVKSESGFTGGILGIADGGDKVVNITECLALQTKLTTVNPDIEKTFRIIANHAAGVYSKNYGLENIELSDPHKSEWDNDPSGKDGGSITSAQAIDAQFYSDSLTWDFNDVWVMTDEGPELAWNVQVNVTHIATSAELNAIRDNAHGSFILDNDIDMDGFSWIPFEFYGTLDGNGFSIKNLEVEIADENAGLFSVINGATVKNIGVEDVYVMCTNQGGAIAGVAVNGATIEKCFATGEINSGGLTGGFIGRADESTVSESYTKITVNGHDHVGGLVGHMNGGTIVNCYTNSTVYSDAWQVGGLVGWAQNTGASISKSFAMGTVESEFGFTGGILGIADGGDKVVNITECLALQTKLTTVNSDIAKTYRIIAAENAGTYSKNYGLETIELSDPNKEAWKDSVGGKDGGSITAAQVLDAQFFADSLTWDFNDVWVMTTEGPELIWAYTPPTSVKMLIQESEARVFSKYGKVWVNDAERDAQIKVYNINGVLLYQKQNVSTSESFEVKGVAIVLIQTPTRRSIHKVVNF